MFIIFDVETTGLPTNYSAPAEDVDSWPRITQLAYNLYDEKAIRIKKVVKLIKPDGWEIPNTEFFIKQGMNQERSLAEGVPLKPVLEEYVEDRLKAHFAIAHNISFDSKIIRAEMIRAGIGGIDFKADKICTMMKSSSYCKIPALNGRKGVKWPTLTELHFTLFGADFEGAHDAGDDVEACSKCFFELLRLGVIRLG